ncbi:MAG: tetratricopeptide repeat protein [Verrucomicrobia bacterium]|nr:tetratricopeptide repeat protein [Verrucomicrobiota bacterium]
MSSAAKTPRPAKTVLPLPPVGNPKRCWVIAGALAALILLCYWQVWRFEFVSYDDTDYVSENAWVQKGVSKESIAWAFTTNHASNWHPLTWLSHMLDWQTYGSNAGGHHFTNVLLHLGNTLLLFLLLCKMTTATWRSAFVAALFAIHPLHVESVAWVSERKDVLSTLFGLMSIWFYASYAQAKNTHALAEAKSISNRQRSIAYGLALLFFALSLMSKPMLVTMPFLLLLMDGWPLRRYSVFNVQYSVGGASRSQSEHRTLNIEHWPRLLLEKLPFLLLTIASCLVTIKVQAGKTMQTLTDFSIADRISNALVSYVAYLGKTFWPSDLAFFYPLLGAPPVGQVILATCVLLLVSFGAILARKKAPYILIGWLWYLGTLVPMIGIVHVGEQALADRYTYFPLIGIFIALVWWVAGRGGVVECWSGGVMGANSNTPTLHHSNPPVQRLFTAVAVVAIIGLALLSYRQIGFWRDSKTLLERALAVTQNNFLAHNNYGVALADNGKFDEAIIHYRRAIKIKPHYARAYSNLGAALTLTQKFQEAIPNFKQALSLRPGDAETHYNLAVTLAQLEDYAGTIEHCRMALEANPNYTVAHFDLGLALSLRGEHLQAVEHFRHYLERFPSDETAQKLLSQSLQK